MNGLTQFDSNLFTRQHGKKRTAIFTDRNPLLSEVLATRLNESIALECRSIALSADLVSVVQTSRPDLLCLDPAHLTLDRNYDLLDFGREIRAVSPKTRLLGYSFAVNFAMLRATLDAGFRGCVSKNATLRQLEIAMSVVLDDGIYFDQGFGAHLRPMMSEAPEPEVDGLSEREKDVLIGLARGLSSKQIAHDLKISNKTVDTYKARAGKKLNLTDKAKLVEYVRDHGWIS